MKHFFAFTTVIVIMFFFCRGTSAYEFDHFDEYGSLMDARGGYIIMAQQLRPNPYKRVQIQYPDHFETNIVLPNAVYVREGNEIVTHLTTKEIEPWTWTTPSGVRVFTKEQWEKLQEDQKRREGNYLINQNK